MSDYAARDKSVDEALEKIQAGRIIMNPLQVKGVKAILSIVWMDGNCEALRDQIDALNPDG